jgi:hypothetical protein
MDTTTDILNEHEGQALIKNFLKNKKPEGATDTEMETVIRWARGAKVSAAMFEMAVSGTLLLVGLEEDEPIFALPEH